MDWKALMEQNTWWITIVSFLVTIASFAWGLLVARNQPENRRWAFRFAGGTFAVLLGIVLINRHTPDQLMPPTTPAPSPIQGPTTSSPRPKSTSKSDGQEENWQKMVPEEPGFVRALDSRDSKLRSLDMWVEGIEQTANKTVVHAAVRGWPNSGTVSLLHASGAYLVDDHGNSYDLKEERRLGNEPFLSQGEVRPATKRRFDLLFRSIPLTEFIRLKHPQFPIYTIYKAAKPSVYFCNPSRWYAASTSELFCDGKLVTPLANGQYTTVQFHSGQHHCGVRSSESLIDLNLVNSNLYYVQMKETFWGKAGMNLVSTQEGGAQDPKLFMRCME
ncbi:MAG: hypothetical protein WA738_10695 [Candidatus Angelobacter sp.]